MTREKFIEGLNFNCKVDGKEVWLNIMPCLEKLLDEHEVQLKAKDDEIERLIAIVEEAMKPKTCDGCKHRNRLGNLTKYLIKSEANGYCAKNGCLTTIGLCCNKYEPKDNA